MAQIERQAQPGDQTFQLFETEDRQIELERMRRFATGLLVLVTLIFVVALLLQERYPWVGFIRATAEAAMVGAIADWFAVTALFRHPLGLPIPHTAIIPRRKESIGAGIGRFVQDNFLAEEVIAGKVRSVDVARRLARVISRPEPAARIARLTSTGIVAILQVVNDEDVRSLIERGIVARVRVTQAGPLFGRVLSVVLAGKRQSDLLAGVLRLAAQVMDENRDVIRAKINKEVPWWLPRTVDAHIYRRLLDTIDETLQEVNADPSHPLHERFDAVVVRLLDDLQHKPELIDRIEALKEDLLQHPIVREFAASLWRDIKALLLAQSENSDSYMFTSTQRVIQELGDLLLHDDALAAKVNRWAEKIAAYIAREYGDEFAQLIAQTVSNWDTDATTQKIELQIGRDLQFIRINGTVVGGLVGLLIYCVSLLVG
jgi:uncharacterized membrane-anchored protein YjiN (DUF445 family)